MADKPADPVQASITALEALLTELEQAVHALTSQAVERGTVQHGSWLHNWYVAIKARLEKLV